MTFFPSILRKTLQSSWKKKLIADLPQSPPSKRWSSFPMESRRLQLKTKESFKAKNTETLWRFFFLPFSSWEFFLTFHLTIHQQNNKANCCRPCGNCSKRYHDCSSQFSQNVPTRKESFSHHEDAEKAWSCSWKVGFKKKKKKNNYWHQSFLSHSSRFFESMQSFRKFSRSRLNFPKFHVPAHFSYFIQKFGRLENLDTETFEQFLHFAAQVPYDHSRKQPSSMEKHVWCTLPNDMKSKLNTNKPNIAVSLYGKKRQPNLFGPNAPKPRWNLRPRAWIGWIPTEPKIFWILESSQTGKSSRWLHSPPPPFSTQIVQLT